jgi:hypothetical protein
MASLGMFSKPKSQINNSMRSISGICFQCPLQMKLNLRQGLALQKSATDPCLVSRFSQGYQVLNLTEGHQIMNYLIQSSENLSLKIENCREGWLVWIYESSNLINNFLFPSGPSILSVFFSLATFGMGRGLIVH